MKSIYQLYSNNSVQDWLLACLAALVVILALHLLQQFVLRRLARIATSTNTLIDDFLVDVLSATRVLFAGLIGVYVGTHFLDLGDRIGRLADRLFVAALILQVGFWTSRALGFWLTQRFAAGDAQDAGTRAMTRSLLSFLGRTALWVLVLLLVLDNLGLNVTALVTSLGIGGIAVALAVQNVLGDLFASLSISIDKPFVIGDFIIVDDLMGTVEHVGLKTTRIRSLGGEQIVLANNDLLKCRIRNYKRMQERRVVFGLGVTYDTSVEQLELVPSLIRRSIESLAKTRFDRAHFKGFGPSSLDFEIVYYVLEPDYNLHMDIQQAINLQLVRDFAEHQVAFAFPTQTLHFGESLTVQHKRPSELASVG